MDPLLVVQQYGSIMPAAEALAVMVGTSSVPCAWLGTARVWPGNLRSPPTAIVLSDPSGQETALVGLVVPGADSAETVAAKKQLESANAGVAGLSGMDEAIQAAALPTARRVLAAAEEAVAAGQGTEEAGEVALRAAFQRLEGQAADLFLEEAMLRRRALVALEQHSEVAGELKVLSAALGLTAERIRVACST